MKLRHYLPTIACVLAIAGCTDPPDAPASAPSALVETHAAESRTMEETLTAYGTVEFAASAVMSLPLQYEARVVKLWVVSGAPVRKGQPIVDLAASATSQLELDKAQRDATAAADERERLMRLRSQGLATESELQSAQNAAMTARELRDSLIARIGAGGTRTLDAPQDGIVDGLTAQPGDLLASGAVIARVAQPDKLIVRIGIEPDGLARIAADQIVRIAPLSASTKIVTARITSVDRRVDPQTHLAVAIINLPRNSGLLPGAAVQAQIEIAKYENAIAVPASAVLYAGDQPYVFVAKDKVAHRRPLHVGVRDAVFLQVSDGLKAGELVIVSGNYELEDGMAIHFAPGSTP